MLQSQSEDRASEADRSPIGRPKRDRIPLGILLMVSATVLFSGSSAISKWLVATYQPGEVLFTRTLVSLFACALFILPRTGFGVYRTARLHHHLARSVSQGISQTSLTIAFSMMPLAGAMAISFSSPLWATVISALLFREMVGPARWLALLIGFVGVLIVTRPGAETFQIGALFALANAILYGSVTAAVRRMTATESAETLTLYQVTFLTLFFACLLPFGWTNPTWFDAGLMTFNGVSNALGQYLWTRALVLAPASAVAPFHYTSLVWAMVFGFLIWGDVPTVTLLIGSSIVATVGLFLLWRESGGR
jgi:drug/metabolite transporter (DMT)-like permease